MPPPRATGASANRPRSRARDRRGARHRGAVRALEFRGREQAARTFPNGLTDRELHDVYVLAWDAPLATYRPDPAEVSGVAAFLTADLLGGTDPLVAVEAVSVADDGGVTPTSLTVTACLARAVQRGPPAADARPTGISSSLA